MVVVDLGALFQGQVGIVVVVGIVMDDLDGLAGAGFTHAQGHRGLAGAGAAGDPDDDRRKWLADPVRFMAVKYPRTVPSCQIW